MLAKRGRVPHPLQTAWPPRPAPPRASRNSSASRRASQREPSAQRLAGRESPAGRSTRESAPVSRVVTQLQVTAASHERVAAVHSTMRWRQWSAATHCHRTCGYRIKTFFNYYYFFITDNMLFTISIQKCKNRINIFQRYHNATTETWLLIQVSIRTISLPNTHTALWTDCSLLLCTTTQCRRRQQLTFHLQFLLQLLVVTVTVVHLGERLVVGDLCAAGLKCLQLQTAVDVSEARVARQLHTSVPEAPVSHAHTLPTMGRLRQCNYLSAII